MALRVPNSPSAPRAVRRPSVNAFSGRWQSAQDCALLMESCLSKNNVLPSATRSTVSGLSRGKSGIGNVALIWNGYGVNFAGRYSGFGCAATISASVSDVI